VISDQAEIDLRGIFEYIAFELTSTYKDCEKEVRELKRKQENLNQYLGRTQPNTAQEQPEKNKNKSL
jgi:plasmid stabilization system protein ParE